MVQRCAQEQVGTPAVGGTVPFSTFSNPTQPGDAGRSRIGVWLHGFHWNGSGMIDGGDVRHRSFIPGSGDRMDFGSYARRPARFRAGGAAVVAGSRRS